MQSTHHAKRTLQRQRVADPYARDPSLPDLAARAAAERTGTGHSWIAVHVLVIVTAILSATPLFAVPGGLAALVAGMETGLAAITAFMTVARNRTIAGITESTGREGYQRILAASARYRWVGSVYGLVVSTGTVILAVICFPDAVSAGLGGTVAAALPAVAVVTPLVLLLLLVAFRFFQAGAQRLRYRWIRSLPETRDYTALNRRFLVIDRKDRLIRHVPAAGVVTLCLFLGHGIAGIPLAIPMAGAAITLLLTLLALLVGTREKVPRKEATHEEKARPASPPRTWPEPSPRVSSQKHPLPGAVTVVHPPAPGTPVPVSSGADAVINRDPINPEDKDFEPWW